MHAVMVTCFWLECKNRLFSVVKCPAVPQKLNAYPSYDTEFALGAVFTYRCESGYYFSHTNARATANITCQTSGQWSTLSDECTGEW